MGIVYGLPVPVDAALIWLNAGSTVSIAGAAVLGFALAPIFPTWISITPQRVGHSFAAQAVGFQVAAANVGIALIPGAVGVLARRQGLEVVPAFLVVASAVLMVMEGLVARAARTGLMREAEQAHAV